MRVQLAEVNYPEHGVLTTVPRIMLVMEDNDGDIKGVDIIQFLKTKDVKDSYRTLKKSKIPTRGMTIIRWPEMNREKDFPYPRANKLEAVAKSLQKSHRKAA